MKKLLLGVVFTLFIFTSFATSDPLLNLIASKHSGSNATQTTHKTKPTKKVKSKTYTHKKYKKHKASTVKRKSALSYLDSNKGIRLISKAAYAFDVSNNQVLVSKNPNLITPVASITKLMTAMVLLDSGVDMEQYITITEDDIDYLKNTFSRLRVGTKMRRDDLLLLALMSSENRAAYALARTAYPGGINTFIAKMNAKAKALGMSRTRFYDPTGLTPRNTSTASDLAKMVKAAYSYSLIREDTTTKGADVKIARNYIHHYINSDALVRADRFEIKVSKTGFINEAGHCLVLYAMVDDRPVTMVFLDSTKSGRILDALAVKRYVDNLK